MLHPLFVNGLDCTEIMLRWLMGSALGADSWSSSMQKVRFLVSRPSASCTKVNIGLGSESPEA